MGYLRLRQICLVAPALAAMEDDLKAIFGLQECYRDSNVHRYGLENVLFPVGTSFIEVVAPTRDGTAAGRFLEQRNGGGYMVILDCDDAKRRRQHAEDIGIRVANLIQYDDYLGVQLHPRDTGAAMIEFNQTRGGERIDGPYHPAGPDWQSAVRTEVTTRLAAVTIEAPDPEAFARRWADLIECPMERCADGQYYLRLDDGDIRFSAGSTSGQPTFSGIDLQVVDCAKVLKSASERGYATGDGVIELGGIKITLSEAK